jgi:hypothetical protein
VSSKTTAQLDEVAEAGLPVGGRGRPSRHGPLVEAWQGHPKRRGLDRVEPRVEPNLGVDALVGRAVVAQATGQRRDLGVVGST